jgi:hypothetical protein
VTFSKPTSYRVCVCVPEVLILAVPYVSLVALVTLVALVADKEACALLQCARAEDKKLHVEVLCGLARAPRLHTFLQTCIDKSNVGTGAKGPASTSQSRCSRKDPHTTNAQSHMSQSPYSVSPPMPPPDMPTIPAVEYSDMLPHPCTKHHYKESFLQSLTNELLRKIKIIM